MKERPILFSAPMVRALLNGSKTQTRRVINPQPLRVDGGVPYKSLPASLEGVADASKGVIYPCPYGKYGDQLWVRETFGLIGDKENHVLHYRATHYRDGKDMGWKPSIHMFRWASRIQLEITGIRVERLNDCSQADAIAEGIEGSNLHINGISEGAHWRDYAMDTDDMCEWFTNPIYSYKTLWESINGAGSWEVNPWVWVVEFKVIKS